MYAIRITLCSRITTSAIAEYFKTFKSLCFEENVCSNHHLHILCEQVGNIDSFRKRMNRHFKPAKNQSYCKMDKGNYAIYISKEKSEPIWNTLYTQEELDEFKALSYIKPKRDKLSQTHKLVDSYVPLEDNITWQFNESFKSVENLKDDIDHMFSHFIENYEGPFGLKHCQEYVFGVMAKHQPNRLRKILKNKILH